MEPESPKDLGWLDTREGREWLESEGAVPWLNAPPGRAWMESAAGRQWLDDLAQQGFEKFFAGEMPDPPDWAMLPATAPTIGARVRLTESNATMAGISFEAGELAIVSCLRLAPLGVVSVELRTLDGRTLLTTMANAFEPA